MQQTQQTLNSYHEAVQNMISNLNYQDEYILYTAILGKCTLKKIEKGNYPAAVSYSKNSNTYILYINPELFDKYSLENRMAILKHEVLHIVNGHLTHRIQGKNIDSKKANIAFDCSINQLINPEHLPFNCVNVNYIQELIAPFSTEKVKYNETAEYYYNLLEPVPTELVPDTDNHSGEFDSESNSEIGVGDCDEVSDAQQQITHDMIKEAIDEIGGIGSGTLDYEKILDLHKVKSKISWKNLIKAHLKHNRTKTTHKLNRRQPKRLDLKGYKSDKEKSKVLYIIDSSGSVSDSAFKKLNSEILSIHNQMNIEIVSIQVDTTASEPEILTKNTKKITRRKGAGTFLSAGLDKAGECKIKYDMVIVSTDGYIYSSDIKRFADNKVLTIFLISPKGSDDVFKDKKYKNIKFTKLPKN